MNEKTRSPLTLSQSETLLGWLYMGIEFLVLPTLIVMAGALFGGFSNAQVNIIYYIVNAACCTVIFRRLLKASAHNSRADSRNMMNITVLGFVAYRVASILIGTAITLLFPDFSNANDANVAAMLHQHPLVMLVCLVVLVPVAEECLFRGLVFLPLSKKNVWLAYGVSALVFASVHVVGYIGYADPLFLAVSFIQYIPAGLCLAWALHKTDSLFAPILIHSAINLLSALVSL